MKTASVRELRYDFPKVERLLSEGEAVQITKRRKVIARLNPERPKARPDMRGFHGTVAFDHGDQIHEVSGRSELSYEPV